MKWLNSNRMRLVVIGIVAVTVFGARGRAIADFVICDPIPVDEAINNPDTSNVQGCSFLHNGLKLYFSASWDRSATSAREIRVIERESQDAPWGEAVNLGPNINIPGRMETYPTISPDDLELYFWYSGPWQPMRSIRASTDDPWGPATEYTGIYPEDFSPDYLTMYTYGSWDGGYGGDDIWMTTRATIDDDWGDVVNLGPNVNNSGNQYDPSISNDGLALFFGNQTPQKRIHMSVRATKDDEWGPAVDLGPAVNGASFQGSPEISPDGSTLYFDSGARGGLSERFWQVSIKPIVDFNSDGIVDAADMCIMVDHWGTDEQLCDIGPMPWGDGIVDVQDLIVLAEHLFKEVVHFGSFTEGPSGTYTMTDRGADTWDSIDQFHFGYKTLTGPGTIVARIDGITNTDPWAKAGVMIRETLDTGSKHTFVFVTPGNGVAFQGRADTNGTTFNTNQAGITAPHWVRLEWDGQGNFTAAHSYDGATWQSVAGADPRSISMNPDINIGLALLSHNTDETCEAVFTDVTITGAVGAEWANTDIGFRLP